MECLQLNIQAADGESSSTSPNVMMTSRNCTLQEVMFGKKIGFKLNLSVVRPIKWSSVCVFCVCFGMYSSMFLHIGKKRKRVDACDSN